MKVLFVSKSINDPATRYRVLPLQSKLRKMNIDTLICDHTDGVAGKIDLLWKARNVDLIFVQRKLFHPLLVRILKSLCRQIVYDFDDAIFCRSNGEASTTRMRKFRKTIRASTLVLAGNEYLAGQCDGASTVVVPTPVDERRYHQSAEKDAGLVLVWVGSRSTRKYLEHHRATFEAIGAEIPGLVLKIIADFEFKLSSLKVKNVPWQDETEAGEIAHSHIGIAPMIDNAWTRGKCALKVIQYMAAGLPVISSRVGANIDVVADNETGLLVDSTEEWVAAVRTLSGNLAEQERMGAQGLKRMKQHYSQEAVVEFIIRTLTDRNLIY